MPWVSYDTCIARENGGEIYRGVFLISIADERRGREMRWTRDMLNFSFLFSSLDTVVLEGENYLLWLEI